MHRYKPARKGLVQSCEPISVRESSPTVNMAQNGAASTQSTLQAAGDFLSQKASQAQSAVADAAQTVKAAVRAYKGLSGVAA